jgi:hypothetical protein
MNFLAELLLARDHSELRPWEPSEIKPTVALNTVHRVEGVVTDSNVHMKPCERTASHCPASTISSP